MGPVISEEFSEESRAPSHQPTPIPDYLPLRFSGRPSASVCVIIIAVSFSNA